MSDQSDFTEASTLAHDLFCTASHTDQCSWGYEKSGEKGRAREAWLVRTAKVAAARGLSPEDMKDYIYQLDIRFVAAALEVSRLRTSFNGD